MSLKMLRHGSRVLKNIFSRPLYLFSTSVNSNETVKSTLFQKLSSEFTKAKPLISRLEKYDGINANFNEWKSRIKLMKRCDFNDLECFEMISGYPSLLEIPLWKFEETILQWHYSDMGADSFKSILLSQPVLLETDASDIKNRIPFLRMYFKTYKIVAEVLKVSPNVMFDNWEAVLMKINYLLKERRYTAGELIQCDCMSQTLDFIKFRFDLLEKCGVYKQDKTPIHKINKYDRSGHINPSLKYILTNDNKKFIKIAKISLEEYEVFKDMFMTDECDKSDSDSDSDEYKC